MTIWERFAREINLTEFAASYGYTLDRQKSTRANIVMRRDHDKIIVRLRGGEWRYFSVRDDNDGGNIVNFVKNRTGEDYAAIADMLKPWIGEGGDAPKVAVEDYIADVKEQVYDLARITRMFKTRRPITVYHTYLEGRGIPKAVFTDARFTSCLYFDKYNNAVLPHKENGAVCGFECKGAETSVFVGGGKKTFWRCNHFNGDDTLIIGEAVIGVLSHSVLFPQSKAVYAATGGGMSPHQQDLLAACVTRFKGLKTVVLAVDHDAGGDKLATRMEGIIAKTGFTGRVIRHVPKTQGQDWNEVLKPK